MGKLLPIALAEEGPRRREAARHFLVPLRFVNNPVVLKHKTGSLSLRLQAHLGDSELSAHDEQLANGLQNIAR